MCAVFACVHSYESGFSLAPSYGYSDTGHVEFAEQYIVSASATPCSWHIANRGMLYGNKAPNDTLYEPFYCLMQMRTLEGCFFMTYLKDNFFILNILQIII